MKKFLMILISTLLVVSVVGCGSSSSDSDDNKTKVAQVADDGVAVNGEEAGSVAEESEEIASTPGPFKAGEFGKIELSSNYDEVKKSLANALLIDIRTSWEREHKGYPEGFSDDNSVVYELRDYDNNGNHQEEPPVSKTFISDIQKLTAGDNNKKIVLICASGSRTGRAAKLLSDNGFINVWHVDGGYGKWNDNDLKVVKN